MSYIFYKSVLTTIKKIVYKYMFITIEIND